MFRPLYKKIVIVRNEIPQSGQFSSYSSNLIERSKVITTTTTIKHKLGQSNRIRQMLDLKVHFLDISWGVLQKHT